MMMILGHYLYDCSHLDRGNLRYHHKMAPLLLRHIDTCWEPRMRPGSRSQDGIKLEIITSHLYF